MASVASARSLEPQAPLVAPIPIGYQSAYIQRLEQDLAAQLDENERLEAEVALLRDKLGRLGGTRAGPDAVSRRINQRREERETPLPAPVPLPVAGSVRLDGGLVVDFGLARAFVGSRRVQLSWQEWRLLALLAACRGLLVTSPVILAEVWPGMHWSQSSGYLIRRLIGRLRQKLSQAGADARDLPVTLYRRGWLLEVGR